MPKLSVNINKVATIRNARGGLIPSVTDFAVLAQKHGAQGITVHPRPDERHIRYQDVRELKKVISNEFNIEGNPREDAFIKLVLEVKPHQVTLVPDNLSQLTSDHGWNTLEHKEYLVEVIRIFKTAGIRTSLFVDPDISIIKAAKVTGTDRIELYTESYAREYVKDPKQAVLAFTQSAEVANTLGLGINAGHDLNLQNLTFFKSQVNFLDEVSIGHALISDCLYYGLEKTILKYLDALK